VNGKRCHSVAKGEARRPTLQRLQVKQGGEALVDGKIEEQTLPHISIDALKHWLHLLVLFFVSLRTLREHLRLKLRGENFLF
jgi:hypothetical protein